MGRNDPCICVMGDYFDDARKLRLLEWLLTPPQVREPNSTNKIALELGVSARTIRDWKSNPSFRARWEKEAKTAVGDPDKVQEVIEEMRLGALDRNETLAARTRAASVYLQAVEGIKPPQADVAAKRAREMSDAELEALIAEEAQKVLAERRAVVG